MDYTLTISEPLYQTLREAVFSDPGREGAAYLLCGVSVTGSETRFLARDVVAVAPGHYRVREAHRLSIVSDSFVPVAKRAEVHGESVLFVHSHPAGVPGFSRQDDREDPKLMAYFSKRAPGRVHGCLVLSGERRFTGRVHVAGGWAPLTRIRVLGRRFELLDAIDDGKPIAPFFDRQVRAFGPDIQRLLSRLHVGVVGAGGTGSSVIEQLCRLGVGTVSVFDGGAFEESNASRVYGSASKDAGVNKAQLQAEHVRRIGLGAVINPTPMHVTAEDAAKKLRDCDVVFGCTDKASPRGILVRLAVRYLIPVFDMAVKVKAEEGQIKGVFGRVTTLLPGEACLFCRGRTTPERIRVESLPPEQRRHEHEEGYIDGLDTEEPAVVTFTTAVAAQAVSELLHRFTGFMGEETRSSEVIMFFHNREVRTNRQEPSADCQCMLKDKWARGDSRSFLELTWPSSV